MRAKPFILAAIAAGACGVLAAPAGFASAAESAIVTIGQLEAQGFNVKIDRIGSAPLSECVVTQIRNPRERTELRRIGGRGDRDTTLFLINNWIDSDPTPKPSNAEIVNAREFLVDRARKCERQRDRFPNLLNVDFYKQGDLFGAVDELNEVRSR